MQTESLSTEIDLSSIIKLNPQNRIDFINKIKQNDAFAVKIFSKDKRKSVSDIIFILEGLGRLPSHFNPSFLFPLLSHENENVRFWVIKTIGKTKSLEMLERLELQIVNESSTIVQREIVSAIGRLKSKKTIPFLEKMLNNNDPKIICQAIRALLVFKGNKEVDTILKKLKSHENEMVSAIIQKEYFDNFIKKSCKQLHREIFPFLKNIVVNGDVVEVLQVIPDESFHLTFTSPPYYNARDYSIYPSYEAYLTFLEGVFQEVLRTTKEGRYLIVNTSPVIIPRISRAHSSKRYPIPFDLHARLINIGWEFIDDIVWLKPEYSVKNRVGGFHQHRKPLAYKPNAVTEYLMVYRKKTPKLIDWNLKQYDSSIVNASKVVGEYETNNVWSISPKADKIHSAIFPVELCTRVIQYYSFHGDLVFDPFAGSGTLGKTAKNLGRHFFLTEKEKKYFDYMKTFKASKLEVGQEETKFLTLNEFKETIV